MKKVATPTLDGVATTEYDATVNLTKVVASKSAAVKASVKTLEGELHSSTLPVQVWIDGQNRVRQISYQFNLRTATGQSSHLSLSVGLSSYGAAVKVTAPPVAQTYNATNAAIRSTTTTS